jgi:uncharacterized protein YpmS
MTIWEKLLITLLSLCIIATICVAVSLTSVSASVTVTFGKQPASDYDVQVAALAKALPQTYARNK